jgi:DNA-binding NarL/FixJ family response regulator
VREHDQVDVAAPVRVVVLDASLEHRQAAERELHAAGFDPGCVGTVADVLLSSTGASWVLLDSSHPAVMASLTELFAWLPGTSLLLYGSAVPDDVLIASLRAGGRGFLPWAMAPVRFREALLSVRAGELAAPRRLISQLLDLEGVLSPRLARLTQRERDVLQLLRTGASTTEISTQLFISTVTVRTHVASLLKKLDVPDRDGAVALMSRLPH